MTASLTLASVTLPAAPVGAPNPLPAVAAMPQAPYEASTQGLPDAIAENIRYGQVTSIHPYDEIEYHWAQQASKSCWRIYRCGKIVTTVCEYKGEITPEEIAFCLMRADLGAGLISRNSVWKHSNT